MRSDAKFYVRAINPDSAGVDFRRQNLTSADADSDV